MNGSDFGQPGLSNDRTPGTETKVLETNEPQSHTDDIKLEPLMQAEKLSLEVERISGLSTELMQILSRLSREIKTSAEQLNRIRSEVDSKKKELKTLHGIEATAVSLERLALDHQRQKETLDHLIAGQRTLWEEEKANRAKEERDYSESLRIRREREEEEYRQRWAGERLKAQQKLDEELRVIQQESLKKQQALERDCLERELKLKEKELEWVQLIQELEQFMSKLTKRTQAQASPASGPAAARNPAMPTDSDSAFNEPSKEGRGAEPGNEILQEPKSAVSSLKEMLLSQGQRIENLKS